MRRDPSLGSIVVATALLLVARPASADRLTDRVNPFIGTGGHGHTYPGPSLPFGMIQPGPDTRLENWDGSSGYHYSDSRILGFSHTHLSGTGIPDYCDVLLMPTTGALRLGNGLDGQPGYSSAFSHDEESARPGYYSVRLRDHDVRAELTTTLRAALHRYTFPAGRPAHVVLDLVHRDRVLDSFLRVVGDREVEGLRRSTGWAKDQRVFFVIRFSRPFASSGIESGGTMTPGARQAEGAALKAWFDFGDGGGPLLVKVGISQVDVEGARRNLDAELPGWDFDEVRAAADAAWERELSRVVVEGGTAAQRTIFYTALYRAMLAPNVASDVDGRYRGRDRQVHRADGFTYYTVFSLWDTFRSLHPLLTLIDPDRTRDFVKTMLRQYAEGGRLPVWELAGNETDTMIGYHAVPVIADAIAKGIDGIDEPLALEAMRHSADGDGFGLAAYRRQGFIPAEEDSESVSRTLEYAYDDWCIAMVARRLGQEVDAERFLRRAQAWKHLFDPSTGFMRARMDGFWFAPFDPAEVNAHYTEANAWQYSFFVPQDVSGLIRAHGGDQRFVATLDALFGADSRTTGVQQADITGMIGQYAHGNEPSHHVAYLYAFAGAPSRTQQRVRQIAQTLYGTGPDGLSGNEDCGQMSAWLVLSALGFYPVTPGSTTYVLGVPMFPRASIAITGGRRFVVEAPDVAQPYVQRVRLNGVPTMRAFLDHAALVAGGTLVFEMGPAPGPSFGAAPADRPVQGIDEPPVVPAPFPVAGQALFRGQTTLAFGHQDPRVTIHVERDGRDPDRASPRAAAGMVLDGSATVKAVAIDAQGRRSPTIAVSVHRLPDALRLSRSTTYEPRYHGGGELALVDGRRGGPNFRLGRWQGYLGRDLEATVDFGEPRAFSHVGMGFLQDTGSWILLPREVAFAASDDGVSFRPLGVATHAIDPRQAGAVRQDLGLDVPPQRARYLRVQVRHAGALPPWHSGAGEPSWFFADEILTRP